MKKLLLLFILSPIFILGQTKIGSDIIGESKSLLGSSISLSGQGDIIAIGAPNNIINSGNLNGVTGNVRVFYNNNGNWLQLGKDINGSGYGDKFGTSVALNKNGPIIAIGAIDNDNINSNSGQVKVFKNENSKWIQIGNEINGKTLYENLGNSVSLNSTGNILIVGAPYKNSNNIYSGRVYIYKRKNNEWVKIVNNINGNNRYEILGYSVTISDNGEVFGTGGPIFIGTGGVNPNVKV